MAAKIRKLYASAGERRVKGGCEGPRKKEEHPVLEL